MHISKRGNSYRVHVYHNKKNHVKTLRSTTDKERQIEAKAFEESLKQGKLEKPNSKRVIELKPDGSTISEKVTSQLLTNPSDLLIEHGFDPLAWELISARNSNWDMCVGQGRIETMYYSRINVKPRINGLDSEELKKWFNKLKPKKLIPVSYDISSDLLLEIPIVDLHLSKLGWAPEVGENYDHKIAQRRMCVAISQFIKRSAQPEKILFPIGNDFFHFDTTSITTTKGTRQDSDLRWQKMFMYGCEILVSSINALREVAPVHVFCIPGNHDFMTSFFATMVISAYYKDDESVIVDTSPMTRKYIQHGKCLIGFSHGIEPKKNLEVAMQKEVPEMWGRTLYREFHLGHLHSEQSYEKGGIIFRRLPSLSGPDAWHFEQGYVGALKKAQAFLWHKKYGLIDIMNAVIERGV